MSLSNYASMTMLEADMVRDAAKSFVQDKSPISVVRAAEAGDWTDANASWLTIGELGWLEIMQYEDSQADGLVAACIIAHELGRGASPVPYIESAVLALPLLAKYAKQLVALDEYSTGEKRVAIAMPLAGFPNQQQLLPNAQASSSWIVNQLESADLLVVPMLNNGQPTLALIECQDNKLSSQSMPDMANNSFSKISGDVLNDAILIELPWQALAQAFDHYRLATSSYVVGLASQAFDMTVEYAKERIAFDKPIGSFQAVQHRLAESALELCAAQLLVQEASVTGNSVEIPMVCIQACEAGKKATFTAQQIWAGMGYTLEVDVQLFFRRARANQLLLGTPWELRSRVWAEVVPHS